MLWPWRMVLLSSIAAAAAAAGEVVLFVVAAARSLSINLSLDVGDTSFEDDHASSR